MSRDASKPGDELRQLLCRIEEIPAEEPRELGALGSRSIEGVEISGLSRPATDPGSQVVPQSTPAWREHPQSATPALPSGSRKPHKARRWADLLAAVVVGVLVVKMPTISIVVTHDGSDDGKSRPFRPAAPDSSDAARKPTPQRQAGQNPIDSDPNIRAPQSATPNAVESEASNPLRPRLTLTPPGTSLQVGQVYPLGPHATIEGRSGTLVVRGLAAGTKLSVGQPSEANAWALAASELNDAVIVPPSGFVGIMDLTIELRLDGAILDRGAMRVEWTRKTPAAAPQIPGSRPHTGKLNPPLSPAGGAIAVRWIFGGLPDGGNAPAMTFAGPDEARAQAGSRAKWLAPDGAIRTWREGANQLGSGRAQPCLHTLTSQQIVIFNKPIEACDRIVGVARRSDHS
jgi:hypothetical protein